MKILMLITGGLMLSYFLMNGNNLTFQRNKNILAITDNSQEDTSLIYEELKKLKTKASNLESTLRTMVLNSHFQNLNACQNYQKDENRADFASEIAGGWVIDTPNTESYHETKQSQATLFGIPIWRPDYFTPRKILQPWSQAGECWAFRGSYGRIKIELARTALIDSFTLEHIPVSASLTGEIDSAPKDFSVLGFYENHYLTIDNFRYNINGPPSQIFYIRRQEVRKIPFKTIMLVILSNWGNLEYTCLYRFKVHGKLFLPERKSI